MQSLTFACGGWLRRRLCGQGPRGSRANFPRFNDLKTSVSTLCSVPLWLMRSLKVSAECAAGFAFYSQGPDIHVAHVEGQHAAGKCHPTLRSLMVSMAARQPTVPLVAPKTGNSRFQSGGSSGCRHPRQGLPRDRHMDLGLELVHRRLHHRDALGDGSLLHGKALIKEGAQSTTQSTWSMSSWAFSSEILAGTFTISMCGFKSLSRRSQLDAAGAQGLMGHQQLAVRSNA